MKNATDVVVENADEIKAKLNSRKDQFIAAMDDDLNTADAITAIFELVKDINTTVIVAVSTSSLLGTSAITVVLILLNNAKLLL